MSLGLCLARHYQPDGQHKVPPHRGEVPRPRRRKELGLRVEREWWIDEEGIAYMVDLAQPVEGGWLPVTFGDRPGPAGGLRVAAEADPYACVRDIQARLRGF